MALTTEPEWTPENNIGQRYNKLLSERKKLEAKIAEHDYLVYNRIIFTLPLKRVEEITEAWKAKVRAQTSFLDPIDQLGIEIFKEDLTDQPNYPNAEIVFEDRDIKKHNVVYDRQVTGKSHVTKERVDILHPNQDLRQQLLGFIENNRISLAMETLIHELVHQYHTHNLHSKKGEEERLLTEAQAWITGSIRSGTRFSMSRVINTFLELDAYQFDFDKDKAIDGVSSMVRLQALGVPQDKIAEVLRPSEKSSFDKMHDLLQEKVDNSGLEEGDLQALDDIYRLQHENDMRKAQVLLCETLDEMVDREKLSNDISTVTQQGINMPPTYVDHQDMRDKLMTKRHVINPATDRFPYNPFGDRTGIAFGPYPDEKGENVFQFGKWSVIDGSSKFEAVKTQSDEMEYLDALREHSKNLSFDVKLQFFNYEIFGQEFTDQYKRILRALFTKVDVRKIGTALEQQHYDHLSALAEKIHLYNRPLRREAINAFKNYMDKQRELYNIFGISFDSLSPSLQRLLREFDYNFEHDDWR